MDLSAIVSAIADKGWRVGLAVALAASLVLWAHHTNWPEPNVLKPWLGTAIAAGALGAAVTLVAILSWAIGATSKMIHEASYAAEQRGKNQRDVVEFRREFYARLEALAPFQKQKLLELIRSSTQPFFVISDGDGPAHSLLGGFLLAKDCTFAGTLCSFNPFIEHERAQVIARLESRL